MNIFIADDSDLLRTRLKEMLSEINGIFVIGEASDASEAVAGIEACHPDAVILDIRMPKGDGIITLETLRRNPKPPIIIMFTNYPYPQYRKKCLQAGADYFFSKSTELENLKELLSEFGHRNNN